MITTTLGDMDETTLDCKRGRHEDENQWLEWVEYRLPGQEEIIHRSVHVHLKKSPFAALEQGDVIG